MLRLLMIGCLFGLTVFGCSDAPRQAQRATVTAVGTAKPLGWVAAKVQPAAEPVKVLLAEEEVLAGAVVLAEVDDQGPFGAGGIKAGDAVVAIDSEPLPIKDDATLDLLTRLEQVRSSGQTTAKLTVLRNGVPKTSEIKLPSDTLEQGLPVDVVRFEQGAQAALGYLKSANVTDPIDLSLLGLAQLANGQDADHAPLLAALGESTDPAALAAAVQLHAETIGALPDDVLVKISESRKAGPSLPGGMPGGMSGSFVVSDLSELPEGIREMVENAMEGGGSGGGMQMMVMSDDSDGEVDMDAIREQMGADGANVTFSTSVMAAPPGGVLEMGEMTTMMGGSSSGGVDLKPILEELDPDRIEQLNVLQAVVDRLIAAQSDDGSWGTASAFRRTTDALAALGAAQRVGAKLPGETIESGVGWLRDAVNEGKLAAAVARGADRREEWVRAAHAVRALTALGCAEDDDMLTKLRKFLVAADPTVFPHGEDLLSHALLARAAGVTGWQRFYDTARMQLVRCQQPDGSFDFGGTPTRDTAIGAVLLALQHERTPVLIGTAENPAASKIDGFGKRPESAMPSLPMPSGSNVQMITDPGEMNAIMRRVRMSPDGGEMDVEIKAEVRSEDPE